MEPLNIDWKEFSPKAYNTIQQMMLRHSPEKIPLGGHYYGRLLVNDICYNAVIGHKPAESLRLEDDELVLAFMAFGPHDTASPYADFTFLPEAPIDFIYEASFYFGKEEILKTPYAVLQNTCEEIIESMQNLSAIHAPLLHNTGFWAKQDAAGAKKKLMPVVQVNRIQKKEVTK